MHALNTIKTVIALLPIVIEAVKTIEAAVPAQGSGKAKLAAVREILEAAHEVSNDTVGTFEQVWPALSSAIGTVVTLFNTTGVFKKG